LGKRTSGCQAAQQSGYSIASFPVVAGTRIFWEKCKKPHDNLLLVRFSSHARQLELDLCGLLVLLTARG